MRWLVLLGGVLALATGCDRLRGSGASGPASLVEARAEGLETALDERKGKVVLVDFWATWCPPCRARFPHFVETHNKYTDKGLVCVGVSLDNEGPRGPTSRGDVLEFLNTKGASFTNFLLEGYRTDYVRVGRRFGFEGSLPFVVLFDKTGKKVWDSEQRKLEDRELDTLIESELAK